MRLGTAIEHLVEAYKYASDKEWIQDKVAWALYHTWKEADRKTEPSNSEIPNNSTISKMEQVDKDINVRSKDEPQTDAVGVPMAFIDEAKFKAHCLNCQRDVADIKCLDCDGDKYFLPDEPQTEREGE